MIDATSIVHDAIARSPGCAGPLEDLAARLLDPQLERAPGKGPVGDPAKKTGGAKRIKVVVCRRGSRLIDCDNLAGGCKAIIDALRYEGLLADDNPESVDLEFRQEKVKRGDMGTEITLTFL
jgi:hypothetical protein